jgi:hypothetical protein
MLSLAAGILDEIDAELAGDVDEDRLCEKKGGMRQRQRRSKTRDRPQETR